MTADRPPVSGEPHPECIEAYHRELLLTGRTIMSVARVRADVAAAEQVRPPVSGEPSTDPIQEIVDAAYPTGGTEGPNAWTEERIRVRTRFAEQVERILARATPPSLDVLREELATMEAVGWPATSHEYRRGIAYAISRLTSKEEGP